MLGKKKLQNIIFYLSVNSRIDFSYLCLGQDINADLCNYHFYDGYALLNLKLKHDFFTGDFLWDI